METISAWWWLGLLVLAVLVAVLYRAGGFRVAAEALGFKVEMEGKGSAGDKAAGVTAASPTTARPPPANHPSSVTASGKGSIAAGRDIKGSTIISGDGNRTTRTGKAEPAKKRR